LSSIAAAWLLSLLPGITVHGALPLLLFGAAITVPTTIAYGLAILKNPGNGFLAAAVTRVLLNFAVTTAVLAVINTSHHLLTGSYTVYTVPAVALIGTFMPITVGKVIVTAFRAYIRFTVGRI